MYGSEAGLEEMLCVNAVQLARGTLTLGALARGCPCVCALYNTVLFRHVVRVLYRTVHEYMHPSVHRIRDPYHVHGTSKTKRRVCMVSRRCLL
jgi:hypothetical protein